MDIHRERNRHRGCRLKLCVAALVALPAGLSGCSTSSFVEEMDSGPKQDVDVSHVHDAIPRAEPRSRYGNPSSYVVYGSRYHVLDSSQGYAERGIASWYGTKFHGRRTSSGEAYDMYRMTAAHKTLPLPTYARVTNLRNGRSVVVKVNDRGPFHQNRIIDLSYAAAKKLGIADVGTGLVEVQAIDTGKPGAPPIMVVNATAQQREPDLYLQVGAFSKESNAQRLQQRLKRMQLDLIKVTSGKNREQAVYRVRIGPIGSVEQADRLARLLVEQGMEHPHVVIE